MKTTSIFEENGYTPWQDTNIEGKLLIREVDSFKEDFRDPKYQLVLATGGFGCDPTKMGNAIFVTEVHNDEPESYRMERYDILGIATEKAIEEWKWLYGDFNDDVKKFLNKDREEK